MVLVLTARQFFFSGAPIADYKLDSVCVRSVERARATCYCCINAEAITFEGIWRWARSLGSGRRATEHNSSANNKRLCGLFCRPPAEVPEGRNVYSVIIIRTLLLSSSGSHHERCQYVHQTAAERVSIKIRRPDNCRIDLLFSFNRGAQKPRSFFLWISRRVDV